MDKHEFEFRVKRLSYDELRELSGINRQTDAVSSVAEMFVGSILRNRLIDSIMDRYRHNPEDSVKRLEVFLSLVNQQTSIDG